MHKTSAPNGSLVVLVIVFFFNYFFFFLNFSSCAKQIKEKVIIRKGTVSTVIKIQTVHDLCNLRAECIQYFNVHIYKILMLKASNNDKNGPSHLIGLERKASQRKKKQFVEK